MKREKFSVSALVLPCLFVVGACGPVAEDDGILENCGDGAVQADEAEQCDDGNNLAGDGCDSLCQTEEGGILEDCGDGAVQADEAEQCDDGNQVAGDGCDSLCQDESFCGDNITDQGEECDDGNQVNTDGCTNLCQDAACGDGFIQAGEICDDGNTASGDRCDSTCQPEFGPAVRHLDPNIFWVDGNDDRLNGLLDDLGSTSANFDPAKRPVATLDFDNTIIKNDIGDATVFFMLNHDKVLQPPNKNWALTSPFLTQAAITALNTACDALAAPGQPLPTSTDINCANEILSIYFNEKTSAAQTAFAGFDLRKIEPGFAWASQIQAGYTPAQLNAIADAALQENLEQPIGATQTVGSISGLNHFVRFYDQVSDLIGSMQADGFDVWIVSASPQEVVEAPAFRLGIASDHVVGIRTTLDANGKLTSNLQGCGGIPDGTNDGAGNFTGNSLITFIDGKRCWINKQIFGDNTATALVQNPDPTKRQVFSAGDSDTDITFMRDATALRLAFNRQKKELMCFAYNNSDGNWLINPTPIQPKDKRSTPYPCSTTGCLDSNGVAVPCVEDGVTIADQDDTVFCAGGTYCSQP